MTGSDDKTPSKIETTSPYYLGPQDRPGDYITPVKLRTNNFDTWAYSVRMALVDGENLDFLMERLQRRCLLVPPMIG